MGMYTLLYLKWVTNKYLLYSTWNPVQCCVSACMGREFGGRMDTYIYIYIYISKSLHCSPETIVNQLNPNKKLNK